MNSTQGNNPEEADPSPDAPSEPRRLAEPLRIERLEYSFARTFFLRSLAIIYFIAFASIGVQVIPLLGAQGLLPAHELFDGRFAESWLASSLYHPTIFYWGHSDFALGAGAWLGCVLAAALYFNLAPGLCALSLWALYLSYVSIALDFMGFQWDNLLLEAGALAIFLAPWRLAPWRHRLKPPSRVLIFLFVLLLARLNFESGLSKLILADPTWRDLTAMDYYYETAPLPTWLGWWFHQLPHGFHASEAVATYAIELLVPLMLFGPAIARLAAIGPLVAFQAVIMATGNYGFFNLLSAALCVFLVDDRSFAAMRAWGGRFRKRPVEGDTPRANDELSEEIRVAEEQTEPVSPRARRLRYLQRACVAVLLGFLFTAYYVEFFSVFLPPRSSGPDASLPRRISDSLIVRFEPLRRYYAPTRAINRYHLFATMTTTRNEIEIQGSEDGEQWRVYEFKYKAGDPARAPRFIAPYHPRLDFQCWFLLIRPSDIRHHAYFANLLLRILEGAPTVDSFFEVNPFPDRPPRYVRVMVYRYTMASPSDLRLAGVYWNRVSLGQWGSDLSLAGNP